MDTPTQKPPKARNKTSAKAIWRDPTPDDPRKRITRTPEEMREIILTFRVSRRELDELYRYARARSATMSYVVREALVQTYPEIFADANRYIRKPRKPKPVQEKTTVEHSLVDGSIKILDAPE